MSMTARIIFLVCGVAALPLPVDTLRPLCTPFSSPSGRWVLDPSDPTDTSRMTWVTDHEEAWAGGNASGGPPCRWLVPDSDSFASCAEGRTTVFAGDSVQRYAWLFLSNDISGCDGPGAPDPWSPEASPICPYIDSMKQAKHDAFVSLQQKPPRRNITLPYKYLRFGYEFFDKTDLWKPDYLRVAGTADAVIMGGFGYWDARYRTIDILLNVFQRFPADFRETILLRNPRLADRLVVMSTTYAENFDSRLDMFPESLLDIANAAAQTAWTKAGIKWFDTRKYTRVATPEQHAARGRGGGKLLTIDGYHPVRKVQEAIAREWMSHVCTLPPAERDVSEGPLTAPGGPETAAAMRAAHKALELSSSLSKSSSFSSLANQMKETSYFSSVVVIMTLYFRGRRLRRRICRC